MGTGGPPRILVVDDEVQVLSFLVELFSTNGWDVHAASSGAEAIDLLEQERFDVVLTDLKMPGADGLDVLRSARTVRPDAEVILMTAYSTVESAIEAMRAGAFHYLIKPFHAEEVLHLAGRAREQGRLARENRFLRSLAREGHRLEDVAAASAGMQEAVAAMQRLADTDAPVLLAGERGTGRGYFARVIHFESGRSQGLFVPVYCAGAAPEILEDELFGHAPGAHRQARLPTAGKVEMADRGTLFVGDLDHAPFAVQERLARLAVLATTVRVGSSEERPVDVRLVASCGPDPEALVRGGALAESLFAVLRAGVIRIPPLRERREDLPMLLHRFLSEANRTRRKPLRGFSGGALAALCAYPWPGNVRELARLVRQVAASKRQGTLVDAADLPPGILYGRSAAGEAPPAPARGDLEEALARIERPMVTQALAVAEHDRRRAAEILRVEPSVLDELIRRYGIDDGPGKGGA